MFIADNQYPPCPYVWLLLGSLLPELLRALQEKKRSRILRILMTTKQKMPKLCIGLRVCQTELLGSKAVHTGISVNANSKSTINSKITAPEI